MDVPPTTKEMFEVENEKTLPPSAWRKKLPSTYRVLFVLSSMLIAGNAGLPDGFFWTKFLISVLLAGILAYRELMENPPTIE